MKPTKETGSISLTEANNLSLWEALGIQNKNLCEWRKKLKPEVFKRLLLAVWKDNGELTEKDDGYSVCRGQDIDTILKNLKVD